MGKIEEFRLELKQQPPVLYGGQLLEGNLVVKTTEAINVQSICLTFQGASRVKFDEWRHEGKSMRRLVFTAGESFFNSTVAVFGEVGSKQKLELQAGHRTYPFQFTIPIECPSAYEGPHGHVRYTVSAKISRPWRSDTDTMTAFTVLRHYDLNYFPQLRGPIVGEVNGDVGGIIHKKGKICTYLQVTKQGFVPGEDIIVWARIQNQSKYEIKWSRVFVQQDTFFTGTCDRFFYGPEQKSKDNVLVILDQKRGPIAPGDTYVWEYVRMRVPSCPASQLPGCQIININYRVQLTVHNPHGKDVNQVAPIVVGTIPLYEAAPPYVTPAAGPPQAQASAPLMPPQPSYAGMAPSYEESVGGKVDINPSESESQHEMMGSTQFAPIYPTYHFPKQ